VELSTAQRLGVLLVPWSFVVCLGALYVGLLMPRVATGPWFAVGLGLFAAVVLCVFVVSAITFSRDVLAGRWP